MPRRIKDEAVRMLHQEEPYALTWINNDTTLGRAPNEIHFDILVSLCFGICSSAISSAVCRR